MKVLSKEPAARYRTADQLGRVLLRFGTQRETVPSPAVNLPPEPVTSYQEPEPPPASETPPPAISIPEITLPEIYAPEIDWTSVALGLVALLAVGGLIPFWIYIFFLYNPR